MKIQNKKDNVIFSDIDGTLCFHEGAHGLIRINSPDKDMCRVKDSYSGKEHDAFDVSVSSYNVYLGVSTQKLGKQLQDHYTFIYVTGGRPSTMKYRLPYLNFANAYILENGGLILDKDFNIDKEWYDLLDSERSSLQDVHKELSAKNWNIDDEGRTSALRIRLKDNHNKSEEEFNQLINGISLPEELTKTINLGNLDIILRSAGKENAVKFWMEKYRYKKSNSIGLGDDINDIKFLEQTGRKFVLANAYPQVLEHARKNKWIISKNTTVDGINEIMNHLLTNI